MKICVVSTSRVAARNLGDQLIADRCRAMLQSIAPDATITTVFRGEAWDTVSATVLGSDLIVLACLAIRKDIIASAYPFLRELVASDVPIVVVAAGLSISAFSSRQTLSQILTAEDVEVTKALANKAMFFSTRGYLTQSLLEELEVKSTFAGDVAFYQPDHADRLFRPVNKVTRVAVSDPHYAPEYKNSFLYLINNLRKLFPEAKIDLLIHGTNDPVIPMAQEAGIEYIEMYNMRGLSHYDDYDLHVGYRIHGHVSALSRRIPSYLLEQDDRGTDYGATFSRRITFASYRNMARRTTAEDPSSKQVFTSPVDTLVAVLRRDCELEFTRFVGMEQEIEACASRNYLGIKAVVDSLSPSIQRPSILHSLAGNIAKSIKRASGVSRL